MSGKVKFTNIGTLQSAKKKTNDPKEKTKFYIKLQQNRSKDGKPYGEQIFPITLANGKVLNDGDILTLFSKKEKFDYQLEQGQITQQKYDQLTGFLFYDVCVGEKEGEQGSPDSADFGPEPKFDTSEEIPF